MSRKSELGYVFHPVGTGSGWRPGVRISEESSQQVLLRPKREDEDVPEGCELLDLEPIAPRLSEVRAVHGRPPRVNSRSYLEGWERIFGGRNEAGQA